MAINICIYDDTANVDKMLKNIALLITYSGILWLIDQYLASQKWSQKWRLVQLLGRAFPAVRKHDIEWPDLVADELEVNSVKASP